MMIHDEQPLLQVQPGPGGAADGRLPLRWRELPQQCEHVELSLWCKDIPDPDLPGLPHPAALLPPGHQLGQSPSG